MHTGKILIPAGLLVGVCTGAAAKEIPPPNIVLILCDDMGYSDIGCYGGEISTPNLDKLAGKGIRFTQFYNTARSCPSRASLMTGLYPHQAGIGHMTGREFEGDAYQGYLNDKCVTLAEVLKNAGYTTNMSGKWHMGTQEVAWPYHRGFENVYAIHNWVDSYFRVLPSCEVYQNDQVVLQAHPPYPVMKTDDGRDWYTTDVFTDKALEQIDRAVEKGRPFFSYVAYNAPHWPLEAHDQIIQKYIAKYKEGWKPLMEQKLARMKQLGIIDPKMEMGWQEMVDWESLSEDDRANLDFRRAIYAAQVEILDQNIGRIVEKLKSKGVYENTVIIFLSDNGCSAEPEDIPFGYSWDKARLSNYSDWKRISARNGASQGRMWSIASNTPFRLYKKFIHEGGISTPFIISYPAAIKKGSMLEKTPCFLPDIMATFVELAGTHYPEQFNGQQIPPMVGRSLCPVLKGESLPQHEVMFWEHEEHGGIRVGDWKLVSENIYAPIWELYNMADDRTEIHNRTADYPDKAAELKASWDKIAYQIGVLPRERVKR